MPPERKALYWYMLGKIHNAVPGCDSDMQIRTTCTVIPDRYRAGLELGEALAGIRPEVVFLFTAASYGGSPELLSALHEGLGDANTPLIGCSGDGIYADRGAADHGAAAVGLNSGGRVTWEVITRSGVQHSPGGSARRLREQLEAHPQGAPDLVLLFSDFRTDASELESELARAAFPVVGGLAADNHRLETCHLYANGEVLSDALVALAIHGPLQFEVHIGNALDAVGKPGVVEAASGRDIQRISGMRAMDFFEQETGKPVLRTDRGVNCLSIIDAEEPGIRRLRSIVPDFSDEQGGIGLYGGIEEGREVQVCLARPEQLIAEMQDIARLAATRDWHPRLALIISCSGRKALLQERIGREVAALHETLGADLPVCGFPSYGEIGPLRDPQGSGYTRNLFHNMTCVLLLIGDCR